MDRIVAFLVGFGRFWYGFIVGDDWTVAATIWVGLVLTGMLNANRIQAWWLVPALVIVATGISLRRARKV